MTKYYTCDACLFQFARISEVDRCPDCGKECVRESTEEEKQAFIKLQAEDKG